MACLNLVPHQLSTVKESIENVKESVSIDEFKKTFDWILSDNSVFAAGLIGKSMWNTAEEAEMEITLEWLKDVMMYNVPHGKQIRGRMVEVAYKHFVVDASEDNIMLARVLGWCVEILQAAFLVADDIMDNGVTRRGQPCWHLVNNMGNIAYNDAVLLEHVAIQILRKYFGNLDIYTDLLDQFLCVTFRTLLGQGLDTRTGREQNFDKYTTSMYYSIVTFKTGYYTVYLPIALSMILAGISPRKPENEQLWQNGEKIALKIGKLFQIQDDYLDCFADQQELGKVASDIPEGKCSWLFVTAKEHCTEADYQLLKSNYGKDDDKKVAVVKALYVRLQLPKLFNECQDKLYGDVTKDIQMLENEALKHVFDAFLAKVYKRRC